MIYECLTRQIKHTPVYRKAPVTEDNNRSGLILITRSLPMTILRVCRVVYAKAKNMLGKIVWNFIICSQPEMIEVDDEKEMMLSVLQGMWDNGRYRGRWLYSQLDACIASTEHMGVICILPGSVLYLTKQMVPRYWNCLNPSRFGGNSFSQTMTLKTWDKEWMPSWDHSHKVRSGKLSIKYMGKRVRRFFNR
jgi:hypothetical protein